MSILSWITGAGKTQEKAVDAVIRTGDALFFTDEEKSVANQKKLDWLLDYMKATSAQSVARRLLAVMIAAVYLSVFMIACVSGYFDRTDTSYAKWLFDVLRETLKDPLNIVVGFYFLTGTVRAFTGQSK